MFKIAEQIKRSVYGKRYGWPALCLSPQCPTGPSKELLAPLPDNQSINQGFSPWFVVALRPVARLIASQQRVFFHGLDPVSFEAQPPPC